MSRGSLAGRRLVASISVAAVLSIVAVTAGEARSVRRPAHVNVNHHVNIKGHKDVNVNVKRNVNVHREVHTDWDRYHYHPVARGVAVGTAAAITAAAIGSVVYSLPSGCGYRVINGVRYYECGGVWYEQRYAGSQLTYIVVPAP